MLGNVRYCGEHRNNRNDPKMLASSFGRPLPEVLPIAENMYWSEQDFISFVLGFAWELRSNGHCEAFDKMNVAVNPLKVLTSPAQLSLCMQDTQQ